MSLNWSVQNVKYFEENPDELWTKYHDGTVEEYEDVNPATKTLIFSTMSLGIGEISYKNAPEFYARWKVMEKYDNWYLSGKFINGEIEKTYLTPKDVLKHLNMSTNVSYVNSKDWSERIHKHFTRENRHNLDLSLSELRKMIKEFVQEFENSL